MAIYDNRPKPKNKRAINGHSVPHADAAPWRNPTAYVLAERSPEGTLRAITSIEECNPEQLADLASATIGTMYMVLRRLMGRNEMLRLLIQEEKEYSKQIDDESFRAFKAEQRKVSNVDSPKHVRGKVSKRTPKARKNKKTP